MSVFEGVISYVTVEGVQKVYLEILNRSKHLLLIESLGSEGTSKKLIELGFLDGQKIKVIGIIYFHRECSETLFIKTNSIIERV